LPESSQAGFDGKQLTQVGPVTYGFFLTNCPGTYKSEIAREDSKELRKLIQTVPPQEPASFCDAGIIEKLLLYTETRAKRRIRL